MVEIFGAGNPCSLHTPQGGGGIWLPQSCGAKNGQTAGAGGSEKWLKGLLNYRLIVHTFYNYTIMTDNLV